MELKDQVVSLELAKEMKELGFDQESLWYWEPTTEQEISYCIESSALRQKWGDKRGISAYTVAELGKILPFFLINIGALTCCKNYVRTQKTGWNIQYKKTVNGGKESPCICDNTEADARARMAIYLKKNSLI